jgi:rifampin ADP-ribosylating transferase
MSAVREPVQFEVYKAGVYLHGTKADLAVGEMLLPAASRTSRRAG